MSYTTATVTITFGPWSVGVAQDTNSNGQPKVTIWKTGDPNFPVGGGAAATLHDLTVANPVFTKGVARTEPILNYTGGGTISATGLPAGLTIDNVNHQLVWDGSSYSGTGGNGIAITFTEVLAGATNTPHVSPSFNATINVVPSFSVNPSLSGLPNNGQTITGADGTYAGYPVPTVSARRIKRQSATPVVVSTSASYTLVAADATYNMTYEVDISNGIGGTITGVSANFGPISSDPGLHAPVLRVYNGTSYVSGPVSGVTSPAQFQMDIPLDVGEGDYCESQIDTVNTFDSGTTHDETRILQATSTSTLQLANPTTFVPQDFTDQASLPGTTIFFIRRRFYRFEGDTILYSAWSNIVQFSTAAAGVTTTFNPSDVSNWNAAITLPSPYTTFTDGASGGNAAARSIANFTSGKYYFRFLRSFTGTTATVVAGGIATQVYGSSGNISTAAGAAANMSETAFVRGTANIYVGGTFLRAITGASGTQSSPVDVCIDVPNKKIYFGVSGVYDGSPTAGTGGVTWTFTGSEIFLLAWVNAASTFQGVVQLETLANAISLAPSGYTPVGC